VASAASCSVTISVRTGKSSSGGIASVVGPGEPAKNTRVRRISASALRRTSDVSSSAMSYIPAEISASVQRIASFAIEAEALTAG